MATIETLLGATTQDIAAMSDEALALYLRDITNLEPKALPTPLGTELVVDADDNPIKLRKPKRTANGKAPKLSIEQLKAVFGD